jgi:HK97 family phage major capsid protein
VYMMSATTALALSLMQNALGQAAFPGITMNGGTFLGVPVIVSEYLANDNGSAGGIVVLANASDVYFADEGGFMLDMSREASVQMDDDPANPTIDSTVLVSLWQRNLVGFRAERTVNWARRRSGSVAYLDAVTWGS